MLHTSELVKQRTESTIHLRGIYYSKVVTVQLMHKPTKSAFVKKIVGTLLRHYGASLPKSAFSFVERDWDEALK